MLLELSNTGYKRSQITSMPFRADFGCDALTLFYLIKVWEWPILTSTNVPVMSMYRAVSDNE